LLKESRRRPPLVLIPLYGRAGGPAVATDREMETIAALRDCSEAAFMTMVADHQGSLSRVAAFFAANAAASEELTERTWSVMLEELDAVQDCPSVRCWLLRTLLNSVFEDNRGNRLEGTLTIDAQHPGPAVAPTRFSPPGDRWEGHWAEPPSDWPGAPDGAPTTSAARGEVVAAVRVLPQAERVIIVLRDMEDLSSEDVCSILRLTESEQRRLLHRARSIVRAALERHYDRERGLP
jgi:RNA polymerase sigma-70 factor (ECF subfamily)